MITIQHISWELSDFALAVNSLDIDDSRNLAIIGQNGSGKTILLESILGLRECDQADIRVDNKNSFLHKDILEKTGAQLQNTAFPGSAIVADILDLHGKLYKKSCQVLHKILDISSLSTKLYGDCSLGQKRRIDLFFAAAHQPRYLCLDEPLSSLDANFSEAFVSWWRKHYDEEKNNHCVFCSHSSRELQLASDLLWMCNGKPAFFGKKQAFVEKYLGEYRLDLSEDINIPGSIIKSKLPFSESANQYTYFGNEALANEGMALIKNSTAIASLAKTSDQDILAFCARYTTIST